VLTDPSPLLATLQEEVNKRGGGTKGVTCEEAEEDNWEPYHYLVNLTINKHVQMEARVKQDLIDHFSAKLTDHWRYMRAGVIASQFPAAKAAFEQRCAA
jgi:hypothetical protein